jgi:hypothetical protein
MTNEQLETELKHAATKEDLHRELAINTRWLISTIVVLQIPTWVAMVQIWNFLATIASKLPK